MAQQDDVVSLPGKRPLSRSIEDTNPNQPLHGTCPHCGNDSQFVVHKPEQAGWSINKHNKESSAPLRAIKHGHRPVEFVCTAHCQVCNQAVLWVRFLKCVAPTHTKTALLYPYEVSPDRVPSHITEHRWLYDEARQVIGISATASAALSRRCMEQLLRSQLSDEIEFGEKETLGGAIAKVVEADPEKLSRTTIRVLRQFNKASIVAAHFKTPEPVDPDMARLMLSIVERLFDDLFNKPHEDASLKAHVEAVLSRDVGESHK